MWRNVLNQPCGGGTQLSLVTASGHLRQAPLYQQNGNRAAQQAYGTAINLAEAEIQNSAFNQAKEDALISLYLKYANFLNTCAQSADKVKALYEAALQRAEARQQRDPGNSQERAALLKIYKDWSTILVACELQEEASNLSHRIHALNLSTLTSHTSIVSTVPQSGTSASIQTSRPASSVSSLRLVSRDTQEKGAMVDRLFEKMLSRLVGLNISYTPSLFLVYAHGDSAQGQAEASTSRYLIDKLKQIRVLNLYSDQTPLGQPYSDVRRTWKQDSQLTDILTSQLCLLPDQLRDDVAVVDKVVVCCSEVLGNYLKGWPHYDNFFRALQKAYERDLKQKSTSFIREIVKEFSQKKDFHHVLTEIAFLQIRAERRITQHGIEELADQHGIIPVSLTSNSYEQCLAHFVSTTTVRIEDIPRLKIQAQAGQEIYPNQSRYEVLFKLIERLLVGNEEAQIFLGRFWDGYGRLISRLKQTPSIDALEFDQLGEGIFNEIEIAWLKQLARIVQLEQSKALQAAPQPLAILGENIEQFKQAYQESLKRTGESDVLSMYVPLKGIKKGPQGEEIVDLDAELERFFASEANVFLLQGIAGSGKSTFNRHLALKKLTAYQSLSQTSNDPSLVFFIELRSIENPNKQVIQQFLQSKGFASEQIEALRTHSHQRCIFIFDGYDEIKERNRNFFELNESWQWEKAKFVITSRPEYLDANYQTYFRPKTSPQALQEVWIAPFSSEQRSCYIQHYVEKNNPPWSVVQYEQAFHQLTPLGKELERPVVLRMLLQILPELEANHQAAENLTLSAVYEQYFQHWWRNWQDRLGAIPLTDEEEKAKQEFAEREGGFIPQGFTYIQNCALALTKSGLTIAQDNPNFKKRYADVYEAFFEGGAKTRILRFNAPFQIKQKQRYDFSHKSMQEYLVARAICAPDFEAMDPHSEDVLNQLSLVNEPVILDFLVEQVKTQPLFKEHLHAWIAASQNPDACVTIGAANAITVLVRAGVQFNRTDLQAIRIPGADLSFGVFDSAQLQSANLSKTNLTGIWLRNADVTGARMDGVQFGELPSLQLERSVNACCYSPDGRYLGVATSGGNLALYEVETLAHVHTFEGHTSSAESVAFSSDSQTLASGGKDNKVRLWSIAEQKPLHTFEGHTDYVTSVAFSSDGQTLLASGSSDNTVRLWSVTEKKPLHTFEGHTNVVTSVAFSSDGQMLASGSVDKRIRLWSVAEKKPLHTFEGHTNVVTSVAFSSDGQTLASGSVDKTVRLWSVTEQKPLHTFEGHTRLVKSVAFSRNGQTLASGSEDETVRLWSVTEKKPLHTFEGHTYEVKSVAFSSDGLTLASGGGDDNTVRLWSVAEKKPLHTLEGHTSWVRSVAFSSNGQTLASGSHDNTVRLWSVTEKKPLYTFEGHTDSVTSVAFSSDGQTLASGSRDETVRLWSVAEQKPLHTLEGHTDYVTSVAFSSDGKTLASGSDDETVRLWSVAEQKPLHTFEGHTYEVTSVAFSSDEKTLASGSRDKTVRLWSVTEQKPVHTFKGHTDYVTSVAFSSDGKTLASGSDDKMVRLWSVAEKKPLHTFEGHTSYVTSVAFSSDGQMLASGSEDDTVRLWSIASCQCLTVIKGFNGGVHSVSWYPSDEGEWLATGSNDKVVRLWQVHRDGEACHVTLHWASVQTTLTTPDICIQDVIGLSVRNTQLLKQRGATGDPHQTEEQEARSLLTETAEASAFKLPAQANNCSGSIHLNFA